MAIRVFDGIKFCEQFLNIFLRGPPKEHSCQVWSKLAKRFGRRCLKKFSTTHDRQQVILKASREHVVLITSNFPHSVFYPLRKFLAPFIKFRIVVFKLFGFVLCTYPVIPSFVHVCIYFELFPLWLFLETDSFVEYCSGSFRAFLHSDY